MKKPYKKPSIVIETFQLNAGVASCETNLHKSEYECEYNGAGTMIYFTAENYECTYDVVNPNEFGDDICYHGHNSEYTFIAS